ncbi:hypothetical protein BV25DRAFT_1835449 [Artomyces pyxidatus]|uniref:Uncharacterized protein n=1 Tax=Artomyces pyxidatus TaxID=48021 RepID=A0ACB8TFD1_9AGAM|nr:hypothetical protein BV25DRAFT_1835449 [Artomyces pyxidatus]
MTVTRKKRGLAARPLARCTCRRVRRLKRAFPMPIFVADDGKDPGIFAPRIYDDNICAGAQGPQVVDDLSGNNVRQCSGGRSAAEFRQVGTRVAAGRGREQTMNNSSRHHRRRCQVSIAAAAWERICASSGISEWRGWRRATTFDNNELSSIIHELDIFLLSSLLNRRQIGQVLHLMMFSPQRSVVKCIRGKEPLTKQGFSTHLFTMDKACVSHHFPQLMLSSPSMDLSSRHQHPSPVLQLPNSRYLSRLHFPSNTRDHDRVRLSRVPYSHSPFRMSSPPPEKPTVIYSLLSPNCHRSMPTLTQHLCDKSRFAQILVGTLETVRLSNFFSEVASVSRAHLELGHPPLSLENLRMRDRQGTVSSSTPRGSSHPEKETDNDGGVEMDTDRDARDAMDTSRARRAKSDLRKPPFPPCGRCDRIISLEPNDDFVKGAPVRRVRGTDVTPRAVNVNLPFTDISRNRDSDEEQEETLIRPNATNPSQPAGPSRTTPATGLTPNRASLTAGRGKEKERGLHALALAAMTPTRETNVFSLVEPFPFRPSLSENDVPNVLSTLPSKSSIGLVTSCETHVEWSKLGRYLSMCKHDVDVRSLILRNLSNIGIIESWSLGPPRRVDNYVVSLHTNGHLRTQTGTYGTVGFSDAMRAASSIHSLRGFVLFSP